MSALAAPARRRITASLLLLLFLTGVFHPLLASGKSASECGMSCCKRKAHREACCCRKKPATDSPGNGQNWRAQRACPPGCAQAVWSFSPGITPTAVLRECAEVPLTMAARLAAFARAPVAPSIFRPALFQRPPPFVLTALNP